MALSTTHPGPLFEATFDVDARTALVTALKRAYDSAIELHDAKRGSNTRTFGYCLYEFAVHELSATAKELKTRMEVSSAAPSFRLRVGAFELACHRVGHSEGDDISVCFPNSECAAYTMVEEQLWLPGLAKEKPAGIENARRLVLAHMGNDEDGFRAVHLCVPLRTEGTRITEWAYTECIWTAAEGEAPMDTNKQDRVPDEVVQEPVVRRKVKKVRENEED